MINPSKLFRNDGLQKQFNEEGFVVLDYGETDSLEELIRNGNFENVNGLNATHYTGKYPDNKENNDSIFALSDNFLSENFENFKKIIAHFVLKTNNPNARFDLHQDWCVVDESQYQTAHVWIAMQDTNEENGGLFVLPKSHRFFNNIRSGSLGIPFVSLSSELDLMCYRVELRKGQAVVYNPALFHGSFANKTKNVRNAALLAITNTDAPLLYYHADNEFALSNRLAVYGIEPKHLLSELQSLSAGNVPSGSQILYYQKYVGPVPNEIDEKKVLNY